MAKINRMYKCDQHQQETVPTSLLSSQSQQSSQTPSTKSQIVVPIFSLLTAKEGKPAPPQPPSGSHHSAFYGDDKKAGNTVGEDGGRSQGMKVKNCSFGIF